jgi:hypothetical protein
MVKSRAGKGTIGTLVTYLVLGSIVFYGWVIGNKYWDFYQFQDAMRQEARFAAQRSDIVIKQRLKTRADSLGLPEEARKVSVRRKSGTISIWVEYDEQIKFPGFARAIRFRPEVVATF